VKKAKELAPGIKRKKRPRGRPFERGNKLGGATFKPEERARRAVPLRTKGQRPRAKSPGKVRCFFAGLNVVSQEVVYIQARSRHGRILSETSMRSVPVVAVEPR